MCEFCIELRQGSDRLVTWIGDLAVVPTLGSLCEGYTLLVPRDHAYSFGELASTRSIDEDVAEGVALVSRTYGPVVRAEHGATVDEAGASCCVHAHLHLIPAVDPAAIVAEYQQTVGEPTTIDGPDALAAHRAAPYLYLGFDDTDLVWPSGDAPRQMVRRVAARLLGIPDEWDWRDHPRSEVMDATVRALRRQVAL